MEQHLPVISILSCGWLGKPLALALQDRGYAVKGARTSAAGVQELQAAGIDGYQVVLRPSVPEAPASFWDADILVINVPPRNRERGVAAHVAEIEALRTRLEASRIKKVLFVSSTSVYAGVDGPVTEENTLMPETPNGMALREVEQLLMQSVVFQTTILRFGGLIGYNRLPNAETLATQQRNNDAPMNAIHRDDCIRIICDLIAKDIWGEVFNACASAHPLRYQYYRAAARALGLDIPEKYASVAPPHKLVNSDKLKHRLGYTFIYDDPLQVFDGQ
ncbi:NAD(P)H-binding protein [Chitinophaga qingshengii]|uniref:NAD(P)H-binding protein n=2 Tax=Chitinophaga qingshengii TaxID=1569794 RepID=A0ABR7TIL1_9BACT|nr:NAD(P)H-binding protein [Chitinophaga qingshengii]